MPTPDLPSPLAVEEIFRAAAALPAADRAAYLEAACQGQPAVRARLERMLALGGIAALLQHGGDETVPLEIEAELARLKPEEAGERIGPYKLLEQIGEGRLRHRSGWRSRSEPVRRRVALKIIKLGMDTKEVIARFEQERQALAMMDHPNIAKVFDAGATPVGPAVLRHGIGARDQDHRLLRPGEPPDRGAARALHRRSARRCSTRIKKGSSTATSSRRTSSSRCTTACRCRRSSTSAWPRRRSSSGSPT